jgi:outer membrane lipoprotein-sorting protein
MTRFLLSLFWSAAALVPGALAATAPDPVEILRKVDAIRNPSESYEMQVRIGENLFKVLISGNARTIVRTLEPARDRGRDLLMIDEEMWAFIPNLKRSVRVSLSQKLTGQAANGDISRMRWAGDYSPRIESQEGDTWVLALQASKKGLTYERLRIWVSKKDNAPQKAEYLTQGGKVLKRARFESFKLMAGRIRPTRMEIESAVNSQDRSTLEVQSMTPKTFSESIFNPQRLGQ